MIKRFFFVLQGNYKPVPSIYTKELRNLISLLLDKNPSKRPSARDVIDIWIPKILSDLEKYDGNKYFNKILKDQLCINTRCLKYIYTEFLYKKIKRFQYFLNPKNSII